MNQRCALAALAALAPLAPLALLLGGALLGTGCSASETPPTTGSGGTVAPGGSGGGAPVGGSGGSGSGGQGSGGAAGAGTGGAGGGSGGSGSGGADASAGGDASDGSSPGLDGPGLGDAPRLMECTMPSIDRVQVWVAAMGEGNMAPAGGSILVREGDHYVGKIELFGSDWHVVPVYPTNTQGAGMVDLSMSAGFNLTYSATSDFYVQMRPSNHFGGGTQWGSKIPSTMGATQTKFIALTRASWGAIPGLSPVPSWTFEESLAQVRAFVFVGNMPNKITFYGLRFDNFVPMCRP